MKPNLLFVFFLLFSSISFADIQPLSQRVSLLPLTAAAKLQLPALDSTLTMKSSKLPVLVDPKNITVLPLQISRTSNIERSVNQIGQWQSINGESVWRLNISAEKALHLNLGFKRMQLPASAHLFVLNAKTGEIVKHYSAADNKFHGELWTPIFETNELEIEINLATTELADFELEISQAGQGIKAVNPGVYNSKSGSCNIDVVCPQGDNWADQIRSVARYTISDDQGTYLCTGTLINNSRQDLTPLFLTAAHCKVSDTTSASMVLYWNYETSVCAGIADGALDQTQNGASLVSRWEGLSANGDFALVRLDSVPDNNFNVHYAGWDKRNQSTTGARAIHHPGGDEKRISIDNDSLTITKYNSPIANSNSHFLMVGAWDEGTTEGGSSGSGLWNLNRHLIGTLSGGTASCDSPTDPDWYGRLASQWIGNNFSSNQLAVHLDPDNSALATLDGINSCSVPLVSISSSNNRPALAEQFSLSSTVSGGSGGYTYEWDFDNNGTIDSTSANPDHTYSSPSNNLVTLVVKDAVQCPGIATIVILAADEAEIFLGDALLPAGFSKSSDAEGSWIVDDKRASEGLFSLKSQVINESEISSIELTQTFEAGTLSFDRRVSSEASFDLFKFFINGIEQFSISGEQDWANVSFPISAGNHTFRWSFEKDGGLSIGQDTAWIDNLQLPALGTNNAPVVATEIANQSNDVGDSVNLDISASFDDVDSDPLRYSLSDGPASLTINQNSGIISGTLVAADAAVSPYSVNVTASDGMLAVTSTFSWTVNAAVAPPTPLPPSSSDGGGGGSSEIIVLGLLLLAIRHKKTL